MVVNKIQNYNLILNLFWTTVCCVPVVCVWYFYYQPTTLCVSVAVSLLAAFIPAKYFDLLQISRSRRFYESLSIKALQSLTQDGRLVSTLAKMKNQHTRAAHKNYRSKIAMYESFHMSCLVFFLISFLYAIYQQAFLISLLIFTSNIIYNVIPILIQQYNKVRLGLV